MADCRPRWQKENLIYCPVLVDHYTGAGMWVRDGHLIRMAGVESISDGTQNLDLIVIDPLNRTLIDDYYALSN